MRFGLAAHTSWLREGVARIGTAWLLQTTTRPGVMLKLSVPGARWSHQAAINWPRTRGVAESTSVAGAENSTPAAFG